MKVFILVLISIYSLSYSQKTIQCEQFKILNNKKTEWTIFTLTLTADKQKVIFRKVSGPDLFYAFDSLTSNSLFWLESTSCQISGPNNGK